MLILVIDDWCDGILWNCHQMNVTGSYWWSVNIGSGNGLVPSGNKPLLSWANGDPDLCRHMVSLGHNVLNLVYDYSISWQPLMP